MRAWRAREKGAGSADHDKEAVWKGREKCPGKPTREVHRRQEGVGRTELYLERSDRTQL